MKKDKALGLRMEIFAHTNKQHAAKNFKFLQNEALVVIPVFISLFAPAIQNVLHRSFLFNKALIPWLPSIKLV